MEIQQEDIFLTNREQSAIQFQYTFKKLEKQHTRNANVYNMFKDKCNAIGLGSRNQEIDCNYNLFYENIM